MNFFDALTNPDKEEHPEQAEVAQAANILEIGEFQFLQLAFHEWHGRNLMAEEESQLFRSYMLQKQVPPWARHYARKVIAEFGAGTLRPSDPGYHRFDVAYFGPAMADGMKKFLAASTMIVGVLFGSLALASLEPMCEGAVVHVCLDLETKADLKARQDAPRD